MTHIPELTKMIKEVYFPNAVCHPNCISNINPHDYAKFEQVFRNHSFYSVKQFDEKFMCVVNKIGKKNFSFVSFNFIPPRTKNSTYMLQITYVENGRQWLRNLFKHNIERLRKDNEDFKKVSRGVKIGCNSR